MTPGHQVAAILENDAVAVLTARMISNTASGASIQTHQKKVIAMKPT
jgi:hypothetical protein